MNRITPIIALSLMTLGCAALPGNRILDLAASAMTEDLAGRTTSAGAAGHDRSKKAVPTKETVVAAVKAYDMEALTGLLDSVDDVRPIVGPDVPLLHLAEEAMGYGEAANPMVEYLVSKKAYTLQYDDAGRSLERVIISMEIGDSPRMDYVQALVGDKLARYAGALKTDDRREFEALLEYMPLRPALLLEAAKYKAARISSMLLSRDIPAATVDPKTGETALHKACDSYPYDLRFDSRASLVKLFLDNGAPVDAKDGAGRSPLLTLLASARSDGARKLGSPESLAALLLERGADPSAKDGQGSSALFLAAEMKLADTVSLLLDRGAALDEKAIGSYNQSVAIMGVFMDHGADPALFINPLGVLGEGEQRELIDLLLAKGVPVASIDPQKVYANFENVRYLVERGAELKDSNILFNALTQSAGVDRIRYLLDHGADVNRTYFKGMTILHYAVKNSDLEAARVFLEKGASVNAKDDDGKTPLDYCFPSRTELIRTLKAAGAVSGS
ncbi:MAG: hypothetical protein CVV47_05920 [Spirochaetae bacterium HGW-Spirochaetae-3]|jgi:ankyrin repeat protein|nr:MAG: hypothetical protein CVV47_05920 [Spirochaetae bacterium HGW-Spirochaetae-3]